METTATTTKVCKVCGRELPIDEFYKSPTSADGHYNQCKSCRYKAAQIRRQKAKKSDAANTPPTHTPLTH